MRRALAAAGVVTVAAVAAGTLAAAARTPDADGAAPPASAAPTATAAVERGTLRASVRVAGTLGFTAERTLRGGRAGTVTRAAEPGRTYRRGQVLYAVDLRPVPLLVGDVPLFRRLATGSRGADVRELERNLVALGHARGLGLTVDRRYTAATAAAVRRWQAALGVPRTGVVEPGDAVVAPGAVRVRSAAVAVGETVAPGGPVATATSTRRGVLVDLAVGKASYAVVGAPVTVTLPTGATVAGTVTRVGTEATGGDDQGDGSGSTTVPVEVTLTGRVPARFTTAPVDVDLVAQERRGVLSVPVEALLSTSGGFAVTVVEGGAVRQVPVRTGLFARGRVEVTGDLRPGDRVEVPTL